MAEILKEEHEDKKVESKENEEEKEEEEQVEKAYDVIADTLKAVVESQKTILESHKSFAAELADLRAIAKDGQFKSPSGSDASMDAQPKVQDKDDIGAEIATVPAEPYEQGEQAKLDGDKTVEDKPSGNTVHTLETKASPQLVQKNEHTFTTETPRPNAAIETVDKSYTQDYSQILKDARAVGHDGLSDIALKIQSGYYYKPSDEEVGLI